MISLRPLLLLVSLIFFSTAFAVDKSDSMIYTEQKTHIMVTAAQPQFVIKLPSNPTTGFSWFLKEYQSQFIQPVKHHFQAPSNTKLIGAPGYELWTFKAKPEAFTVSVQTPIHLTYARPWEKAKPVAEMTFWVSTTR